VKTHAVFLQTDAREEEASVTASRESWFVPVRVGEIKKQVRDNVVLDICIIIRMWKEGRYYFNL
jgi:hypothetical protein